MKSVGLILLGALLSGTAFYVVTQTDLLDKLLATSPSEVIVVSPEVDALTSDDPDNKDAETGTAPSQDKPKTSTSPLETSQRITKSTTEAETALDRVEARDGLWEAFDAAGIRMPPVTKEMRAGLAPAAATNELPSFGITMSIIQLPARKGVAAERVSGGMHVTPEAVVDNDWLRCKRISKVKGASSRITLPRECLALYEGDVTLISAEQLLQLRKFYLATALVNDKVRDLQQKLERRNPFCKDYQAAEQDFRKQAKPLAQEIRKLRDVRKEVSGAKMVEVEDALREKTHRLIAIKNQREVMSAKFWEWEKKNPLPSTSDDSWANDKAVAPLIKKWKELNAGIEDLIIPEAGTLHLSRKIVKP